MALCFSPSRSTITRAIKHRDLKFPTSLFARWSSAGANRSPSSVYRGTTYDASHEAVQKTAIELSNERKCRMNAELGKVSGPGKRLYSRILSHEINAESHLQQVVTSEPTETELLEAVRVCLVAEWHRVKKLPRKTRSSMVRKEDKKLARQVLLQIWKSEELSRRLTDFDSDATFALCFFAVAEGLQSYIIDWILHGKLREIVHGATRSVDASDVYWRNNLFRNLLDTTLMHDVEHSADTALRMLFEMLEKKQTAANKLDSALMPSTDPIIALSVSPSMSLLLRMLGTGDFDRTNLDLYDRFTRLCEKSPGIWKRPSAAYNLCVLKAHRPSDPDIGQAIKLLRSILRCRIAERSSTIAPCHASVTSQAREAPVTPQKSGEALRQKRRLLVVGIRDT